MVTPFLPLNGICKAEANLLLFSFKINFCSCSPKYTFYSCKFVAFYFIVIHDDPVWIAGGTFALYSLLCRHVGIGILPSKHVGLNTTKDVQKSTLLARFFQTSLVARRLLLFVAMLGTCMLIGDGILTPAISGFVTVFFRFYHLFKSLIPFLWLWNVLIWFCLICFQYCQLWMDLEHLFLQLANVSFGVRTVLLWSWYFAASIYGNCQTYWTWLIWRFCCFKKSRSGSFSLWTVEFIKVWYLRWNERFLSNFFSTFCYINKMMLTKPLI